MQSVALTTPHQQRGGSSTVAHSSSVVSKLLRLRQPLPSSALRALTARGSATKAEAAGMAQAGWDSYKTHWEDLWREGVQPKSRFDAGQASPQLHQLLSSGDLPTKGKRALVPGCGRGYDVAAFAASGADATGLEISTTAIRDATAYLEETLQPETAKRARVVPGDFLQDWSDPAGPFDIGYDYTFLCALHPDMRTTWASSWARQLAPGGELVTLVFPVDPSRDRMQGPPYPVTPELYTELLTAVGFECKHLEPIPNELSHPARAGREWLGRWKAPGSGAAAAAEASSKI